MLEVIRGASSKIAYSERLISILQSNSIDGLLYTGYPVIGGITDKLKIDAMLISEKFGVVIFNIEQKSKFVDKTELQDEIYNNMEARLKRYKSLTNRRKLMVEITVIDFAPSWNNEKIKQSEDFLVCNESNIIECLNNIKWSSNEYYPKLVEAIQLISQLKKKNSRAYVTKEKSRGAKLKDIEDEISSLDHCQSAAVIETVKGVQRIRGLAGSGKTIVLALKVAYLYSMFDNIKIAVTFNTRSLKGQFEKLITNFIIENTSEEPDWSRIRIIHAWGSSNSEGLYYDYCIANNIEYLDYKAAKNKYQTESDLFGKVCEEAVKQGKQSPKLFDVILIDEAQDFSKYFFRMCYNMLPEDNKMLVYAYDELQNLNNNKVDPPEELFGYKDGKPLVVLKNEENKPREDVILYKCYRNSRPILTTAHSLGFGIYRKEGLVQLFEDKSLWKDIGYKCLPETIIDDEKVTLTRTNETSPDFLQDHSSVDDILIFKCFDSVEDEADWVAKSIIKNLQDDELRYDDIIIIHPDPITTRHYVSSIRTKLMQNNIETHIAGYNTSPDQFFADDSITISQIYRAKGNEAAMVYFVNADYCYSGFDLGSKRNILFTGITRSKAWVRVSGVGDDMKSLIEEFEEVKNKDFTLEFTYPNEEKRNKMRMIHRDRTQTEKETIKNAESTLKNIAQQIKAGKIQKEDFSQDILDKFLESIKDAD